MISCLVDQDVSSLTLVHKTMQFPPPETSFSTVDREMRRASGGEAKSPRLLIAVDVMGSPGSFKFLVNDGDPVSTVIATTLRNYSKEGRIPVLGTHVDDFLLYSTGGWGTSELSHGEMMRSLGCRTFLLCEKRRLLASSSVVFDRNDVKVVDSPASSSGSRLKSWITKIKMVDGNSNKRTGAGGGSASRPKRGEIMDGKNRRWGRSFLNRLNVTSCARSGTFNSTSSNGNQRKNQIVERKDELVDVVSVAEEEEEEVVVVVEVEENNIPGKGEDWAGGGVDDFKDVEVVPDNQTETSIAVASKEGGDWKKQASKKINIEATTIGVDNIKQASKKINIEATTIGVDNKKQASKKINIEATTIGVDNKKQASKKINIAATTIGIDNRQQALKKKFTTKTIGDDSKKQASKKKIAATAIQASFRGHLARRASRALRGLVKIQALARGMQVRRQAHVATTCMQALVRLQLRARDRRLRIK
ncbi:hypothetical protein ZOSMA_189G00350 [Zostera marina]|uniref:DUF7054 domain-containing protein n=1 Tax=Zostera marina TaxID=29655 RepID=A0A0K9PQ37_ZOSMR|nr:hypothetical protein ZOSMA_189G00350 [Zostera marina]